MVTAFFRTLILYLLLITGLRLTGKRQLGELEPVELVLTLLISDLASVPMQDFGIPLLCGIVPILVLLCLSMLLSCLSLRSVRFRSLICGQPTLIIRDGHIQQQAMRRNRLTVDELMESLRMQGVTTPEDVKYAVLETSGQISLLLHSDCQPLTARQLGLSSQEDAALPTILINDGRLMRGRLKEYGLDEAWLQKELARHGLHRSRDVFLLSVDENGTVICLPREVDA